jgi:uncharacterized membrane protein
MKAGGENGGRDHGGDGIGKGSGDGIGKGGGNGAAKGGGDGIAKGDGNGPAKGITNCGVTGGSNGGRTGSSKRDGTGGTSREGRRWFGVVSVLAFGFFAFFSLLLWRKYAAVECESFDLAIFSQVTWKITRGATDSSILGISMFGDHLSLVLFLLAPLYALFPSPFFLILVQTLALAVGAFPLYLAVKEDLGERIGALFAGLYLLYSPLGYVANFDFHPPALAVPLLLFAYLYYRRERYSLFVAFLVLSTICSENVSPVVFMFGFLALVDRRSPRWSLFPLLFGGIYFAVGVGLVIPYFNPGIKKDWLLYAHIGRGLTGIVGGMLRHPLKTLHFLFSPGNLLFLLQLLGPLCFLSLLDLRKLSPALPAFLVNMLSIKPQMHTIQYHYTALLVPFLILSAAGGYAVLYRRWKGRGARALVAAMTIVLGGVFLPTCLYMGPHRQLFARYYFARRGVVTREKERLAASIPSDRAVSATVQFLPRLSNRHRLYDFTLVVTGHRFRSEEPYHLPGYVNDLLVDFADPITFPPGTGALETIHDVLLGGEFGVVDGAETAYHFRRGRGRRSCRGATGRDLSPDSASPGQDAPGSGSPGSAPPGRDSQGGGSPARGSQSGGSPDRVFPGPISPGLVSLVESPDEGKKICALVGESLAMLGFSAPSRAERGKTALMTFFYQRLGPLRSPVSTAFALVRRDGRVVMYRERPFCYRLLPESRWPEDKIAKEVYRALIPATLAPDEYEAAVAFLNPLSGRLLEVSGLEGAAVDRQGWVHLGRLAVQ